MTELLPCPFCGGEAELHASYDMDTNEVDGWFAWCNNEQCECKPETNEYFTEAEAIAAWNTRAETPIVRCRDCKHWQPWMKGAEPECWAYGEPFSTPPDGFCAWGERK